MDREVKSRYNLPNRFKEKGDLRKYERRKGRNEGEAGKHKYFIDAEILRQTW